jgi:hypothetical protein
MDLTLLFIAHPFCFWTGHFVMFPLLLIFIDLPLSGRCGVAFSSFVHFRPFSFCTFQTGGGGRVGG